jgi:uncharacterized membrane protein (UPF0127 family)
MGRQSLPADFALVFPFDEPPLWVPDALGRRRAIHMLFVRTPIDVIWLRDDVVQQVKTLQPWRGFGWQPADTVIELPAGAAAAVEPGDTVTVTDESS